MPLWTDIWLIDQPFYTHLTRDLPLLDLYRSVYEYWILGMRWDWNLLVGFLPACIENYLAAVILYEDNEMEDELGWEGLEKIIVSSTYEVIT